MTFELRTTSASSTRQVAAVLGTTLSAGDVVVLVGDLGAGKTTFAQGLAYGLGVDAPVTSPSFTLVQEYAGRVPVAHVDVYRLERVQELYDLGFEELIDGDSVTMIEWGDAVQQILPPDHVVVRIEAGMDADERTVTVDAVGPGWHRRQAALERTLDRASARVEQEETSPPEADRAC
jgi:tRNA threonylcarbamoyladenosine biosynthesis protein TsaE